MSATAETPSPLGQHPDGVIVAAPDEAGDARRVPPSSQPLSDRIASSSTASAVATAAVQLGPVEPASSSPAISTCSLLEESPAEESPADYAPAQESPAEESRAESSASTTTFPAWYRNEVFEVVDAIVGRSSYHQDETISEALQHLMLRDVLACVEASLRDEETPLLQQQDGFNMAYFSTELKRAVAAAVIQLQRMQAQVEADADGPLQARRRPDEVADTAWAALVEPIDDDNDEF